MRRRLGTSLYAGPLFTVLGTVGWATDQPVALPSLGPSAFVLAFKRLVGGAHPLYGRDDARG